MFWTFDYLKTVKIGHILIKAFGINNFQNPSLVRTVRNVQFSKK